MIKEQPKIYYQKDIDEAYHIGYRAAEEQYANHIKKLKEEIKRLKNG